MRLHAQTLSSSPENRDCKIKADRATCALQRVSRRVRVLFLLRPPREEGIQIPEPQRMLSKWHKRQPNRHRPRIARVFLDSLVKILNGRFQIRARAFVPEE